MSRMDPAFKREQFKTLAEKIGRIKPFKTKRISFTPKQRAQVHAAFAGLCANCDAALVDGWEIDHIKRLADEGQHVFSNWQALCKACHSVKTIGERKRDAKADRQSDLNLDVEVPPTKNPIRGNANWPPKGSQGFDKRPFPATRGADVGRSTSATKGGSGMKRNFK